MTEKGRYALSIIFFIVGGCYLFFDNSKIAGWAFLLMGHIWLSSIKE